jgi:hypothetical protein
VITEDSRVWWNGSWDQGAGISLYAANAVYERACPIEIKRGFYGTRLDAGYAPRRVTRPFGLTITPRADGMVYCAQARNNSEWQDIQYRSEEFPQGQFLRHVVDGCTLLAWWDRSHSDKRAGINSTFIVEGAQAIQDMLEWFPRFFPRCAQRIRDAGLSLVDVTEQGAAS